MKKEESIYQEIASECMSHFGIEEQEFIVSQQVHMSNPQFQRIMMEMQMGFNDEEKDYKPKFTKDKAKEMFEYMEELKFQTMDTLAKAQMDPNDPSQQEEFTITMLCENAKTGDKLFEKYQVDEEEFTKAFKFYQLMNDPDITRLMQENMQKLGPEAMQMMMGGMGGGGM